MYLWLVLRVHIFVCMSEIVYVGRYGYLYVLVMNVCLFCICLLYVFLPLAKYVYLSVLCNHICL